MVLKVYGHKTQASKIAVNSHINTYPVTVSPCLATGGEKFGDELKTLMTLKFRSFENVELKG